MNKTVRLDEVVAFKNSLAHDLMKSHERVFGEKIRSIKRASEDITNIAGKLEIAIKNAWGSLDKTTSEQGLRLTQTIKEAARQLAGQGENSDYANSERFHTTAVDALNKIILSIRKYVPKLHRVLKTDIAALNSALTKLEGSVNSLGTALDGSPGRALESLESEIKIILQKNHALKELHVQNQELERSILETKESEDTLLREQDLLMSKEEFRRLHQYHDSLESKGEEIEELLQLLAKPLRKFERTLSDDDPTVDRNILTKLIENPKEAILRDDPQIIRQLFNSLDNALSHGKLEIEERKRRKAQEVIQAVNQGALEQLRTAYLTLWDDTQTAMQELAAHGLIQESERLSRVLAETRSKSEQLKVTQNDNAKKIEELTKTISKQKSLIETRTAKLSGQQISLVA